MKRVTSLIIVFCWLWSPYVHATMLPPYFNVTVNENTIGGDGNFIFHIQVYSHDQLGNIFSAFGKDFQIQTTNDFGTNHTTGTVSNGDSYYITQDVLPGWQNSTFTCSSDNPSVSFASTNGGVLIAAYPYSNVICNFINSKQSSKVPVLFIPGVLGTDINKQDERLWLDLDHNLTDVGDQFMDPLQFQTDLNATDSSLTVGEVVGKPNILFDYSDGLIQEFQNQGYTQGTSSADSLFLFPYDWRYGVSGRYPDGSMTEDLLKTKIQEILDQTHSDKVDVVAHSTGGLLLKQYVMDNPTDNHIGKAVFVGVPNTGSPMAIKTLLEGDSFGIPWLADSEMMKIAQNLPVVYDLMPSGKYYAEKNGPVEIFSGQLLTTAEKELNYDETNNYLTDSKGLNGQAVSNAKNLHTLAFDNFDLRTAGVDLYAIDGCKTGTLSQIWDFQKSDGTHIRYDLGNDTPGDGTVPLESSTNLPIDENHKYYALKADHAKMPSQDGIREEIVNLISGSQLSTQDSFTSKDLITQDINKCKLNGNAISVYSPLDIDIVDQGGNHSGLLTDGVSIENDIPNADFEISGDHKFVYLPTDNGQTYVINIKGSGSGIFTLKDGDISSNQITQTEVFSNIPVTTTLTGQVNLGGDNGLDTLSLQSDSSSQPVVVSPDSVINADQSQDLTPPVSTSTIIGTVGDDGDYVGDVSVALSAMDPVVNSDPDQTSGVLKTVYSLDSQDYQIYNSSTPISIATTGQHTLSFYSTDRAGNNEAVQVLNFSIGPAAAASALAAPVVGGSFYYAPKIETVPTSTLTSTSTAPAVGQVLSAATGLPIHGQGSLVVDSIGTVYLIQNSVKHPFTSARRFLQLGYKFKNVQPIFPGDSQFMLGMPM